MLGVRRGSRGSRGTPGGRRVVGHVLAIKKKPLGQKQTRAQKKKLDISLVRDSAIVVILNSKKVDKEDHTRVK